LKKQKQKQNKQINFQIQVVRQTDVQVEKFVQFNGVEDIFVVYLVMIVLMVFFFFFSKP